MLDKRDRYSRRLDFISTRRKIWLPNYFMKRLSNFIVFLSIATWCEAQQTSQQTVPPPTPFSVTSREANARVWESTSYDLLPSGQTVPHLHSYTELATGLCYRQNGQWLDSQEQISILPDGSAEAVQGQHQAYFPADIYDGVIKLVTPDGLLLQSQPFGLSYDDGTNTTIIAELTNSVGQLISPNQILYPSAFAGIDADLLYTYKKGGFEQDVIFREQVPTPEQFGLSSVHTRLQLLTAFFNPPTPVETSGPLNPKDGLQDTSLTFGAMKMINGHAFLANATGVQNSLNQRLVYKSWVIVDGQQLLIEQLPYQSIGSQMATLPQMSASALKIFNSGPHKLSLKSALSRRRTFVMSNKSAQLARADSIQKPGVVFDYVTINANETNFTFQGDTTYFISSPFNLLGTTTIEGGAIIKMTNYIYGGNMINIDQDGTVDCLTAPYRPAVFTSSDDNTLGETYPGSTGSPGLEENIFDLVINSNSLSIHDCRFNYAYVAINQGDYPATINITNCQFENTEVAVAAYTIGLYNVLIGVTTNSVHAQILSDQLPQVYMEGTNLIAENVTADSGYAFVDASTSGETLALTNCLITSENVTDIDNPSIILTNGVVYLPSPSAPVYQVVGGGNYYLTNGSPYHACGTTNIDSGLLAYLAGRTTFPPIVYTNLAIYSSSTFSPIAQRDNTGPPDLGYHYDPLDYVFGGCDLYTNLAFTAGTAVGWFENYGSQ
jgi:hypothetical protein